MLGEAFQASQEPPQTAVAELAARAEELRTILAAIDQGVRLRDTARASRDRLVAEYDVFYTYSARPHV